MLCGSWTLQRIPSSVNHRLNTGTAQEKVPCTVRNAIQLGNLQSGQCCGRCLKLTQDLSSARSKAIIPHMIIVFLCFYFGKTFGCQNWDSLDSREITITEQEKENCVASLFSGAFVLFTSPMVAVDSDSFAQFLRLCPSTFWTPLGES